MIGEVLIVGEIEIVEVRGRRNHRGGKDCRRGRIVGDREFGATARFPLCIIQ
jgi:hypothetical protein